MMHFFTRHIFLVSASTAAVGTFLHASVGTGLILVTLSMHTAANLLAAVGIKQSHRGQSTAYMQAFFSSLTAFGLLSWTSLAIHTLMLCFANILAAAYCLRAATKAPQDPHSSALGQLALCTAILGAMIFNLAPAHVGWAYPVWLVSAASMACYSLLGGHWDVLRGQAIFALSDITGIIHHWM